MILLEKSRKLPQEHDPALVKQLAAVRQAETLRGQTVDYSVVGEGNQPLVLFGGFNHGRALLGNLALALAAADPDRKVVVLDQNKHGPAPNYRGAVAGPGIRRQTENYDAVLTHEGLTEQPGVQMVGLSMGSLIIQEIVIQADLRDLPMIWGAQAVYLAPSGLVAGDNRPRLARRFKKELDADGPVANMYDPDKQARAGGNSILFCGRADSRNLIAGIRGSWQEARDLGRTRLDLFRLARLGVEQTVISLPGDLAFPDDKIEDSVKTPVLCGDVTWMSSYPAEAAAIVAEMRAGCDGSEESKEKIERLEKIFGPKDARHGDLLYRTTYAAALIGRCLNNDPTITG